MMKKHYITIIYLFFSLSLAVAMPCVCPPGKILVEYQNSHAVLEKPDRCGVAPTAETEKKCWRWEAWPQQCRWLQLGDPGGYAGEYVNKCYGVEKIFSAEGRACVLPPTKIACLCIDRSVHLVDCNRGEIAIHSTEEGHYCVRVVPPQRQASFYDRSVADVPSCRARDPNNCPCQMVE